MHDLWANNLLKTRPTNIRTILRHMDHVTPHVPYVMQYITGLFKYQGKDLWINDIIMSFQGVTLKRFVVISSHSKYHGISSSSLTIGLLFANCIKDLLIACMAFISFIVT